MKINFTKKEFQLLVTMLEISDWVMHAHYDKEQENTKDFRLLRNKILSYADQMGMKGCYRKEGEVYYESHEYEQSSAQRKFLDVYDEDTFWSELLTKLVDRDYEQQYGNEEVDLETKLHRITQIEHGIIDELNESGLSNLQFKNSNKKSLH